MKILIVCYHDPKSNMIGAVRIRKFAENFAASGCSVKVLSRAGVASYAPDLGSSRTRAPVPQLPVPQCSTPELERSTETLIGRGTDQGWVMQIWTKVRPKLTWVFRHVVAVPDAQIFSIRTLIGYSSDLGAWVPQVILVSGPPFSTFFVAQRIARRFRIPWVADYRDLWSLSTYYNLGPVRSRVDSRIESRLVRSAALVTTTSEPWADEMRSAFGVRSEVVFNGFDPSDLGPLVPPVSGTTRPLRIVYTGIIYEGKRDPEPLFVALASMGLGPDQVLVEFYGDNVHLVEAAAQRHGVERLVRCAGRLPHSESLALQQGADVLLLLMWNHVDELGTYGGKLFEYLGVRRPILMLGFDGGVAADLIRSRGAGVIANDPGDIASAIRTWLAAKRKSGFVGILPQTVSAGLTRQEQSERLRQLCESVISSTSRGAAL